MNSKLSQEERLMSRNTTTEKQQDLGQINWAECPHVKRDPAMMSGAWCLGGTRLPLSVVFTNLASGMTIAEVTEQFPGTRREHITDVLDFLTDRLKATQSQ